MLFLIQVNTDQSEMTGHTYADLDQATQEVAKMIGCKPGDLDRIGVTVTCPDHAEPARAVLLDLPGPPRPWKYFVADPTHALRVLFYLYARQRQSTTHYDPPSR